MFCLAARLRDVPVETVAAGARESHGKECGHVQPGDLGMTVVAWVQKVRRERVIDQEERSRERNSGEEGSVPGSQSKNYEQRANPQCECSVDHGDGRTRAQFERI